MTRARDSLVSRERWKEHARPVSTNATMTPRCDGPRWSAVVGDAMMSTVRAVSTFFFAPRSRSSSRATRKVGVDGARDASGRTRGGAATVFARVGWG